MHVLQIAIDELTEQLRKTPESSHYDSEAESAPVDTAAVRERMPMQWDHLGPTMLAMQKLMLVSIHDLLQQHSRPTGVRFQCIMLSVWEQ